MGKYDVFSDNRYKDFALKAAKELLYPEETLDRIRNAKNEAEISRIMLLAAKEMPER